MPDKHLKFCVTAPSRLMYDIIVFNFSENLFHVHLQKCHIYDLFFFLERLIGYMHDILRYFAFFSCHAKKYQNCDKRFTISMAESAQSYPLFPALLPALAMACSILSVVRIPNITGTPVSRET